MARSKKVVKYRRPININLGVITFIIIFIYLAIQLIIFLNEEQLSVYEVTQNTIADDNTYQGLIIRDEVVYSNQNAGYLNYYVGEGARIAKNKPVYSLDSSGKIYEMLADAEQDIDFSSNDIAEIRKCIESLNTNYSGSNYNEVYSYKYGIENTILELTNVNMLENVNKILQESNGENAFSVIKSDKSGVVSYYVDGLESTTLDNFTSDMFETSDYQKTALRSTDMKEVGSPVYKLVTEEDWSIVIPLNDQQYEALQEKKNVKVNFVNKKIETIAGFEIIRRDNKNYGVLYMTKYMLQFLSDRYVTLEIVTNSATGYKIPTSSVTEKEFYKIPLTYFTKGGNKNSNGVVKFWYKENGEPQTEFVAADIYYEDENYGYIDTSVLEDKSIIIMPNSTDVESERYEVSETAKLQGVYNVNKGYPVFKRIEVLYENPEYYLVDINTKYGLNNYDRIILNVALAKEQHYVE